MIERDAQVVTRHGLMPTFAVHPEGTGPFPGVLLLMDAPGIREELRNIARRIARQGYFVLLPDMYYRLGHLRFDLPRRNDAMGAVIVAAMRHLNNDLVMEDIAGALAFLDAQDKAKPGMVGALGYCMSGRYAVVAAARFPHRFASVGSLYGVGMVNDDDSGSPHVLASSIKAEVYCGFAETDTSAPPEKVAALKAAFDAAGVKHLTEVYPNSRHGYGFAAHANYETIAAEKSWQCLFEMWDRTLT